MNSIEKSARVLATACNGNPIGTTVVLMLFFVMFNVIEANIETLIFGHRFEHWLDVVFQATLFCYAAYLVWVCAVINTERKE